MNKNYARLSQRVKAAIIDAIILIAMMYAASDFLYNLEDVPDYLRWSLLLFVFVLYDPILTSIFGATLGQSFTNIGVRRDRENSDKKILFPQAVARFILKAGLGWISLLTISGNKKRKAIHDMVVQSVVIEVPTE